MTSDEKFQMVHGSGGGYVGNVPEITLSDGTVIPPINLEDGPQGVADGVTRVTAWPSALTVVQSWDPVAMNQYGAAMGREQWLKGSNVMLGPGVNLARVPWCGRNFEYQGEDPVLASRMIAAEIQGIQSNNVSACVKHYVFNSQEFDRSGQSANVPDRAAKELYYKPFAAAVDAGVGSAMCSYNRVNGTWACENANSLNEIKTIHGFAGWMMSDWGATHSTEAAANNGLDQQMPDDGFFGAPLRAAVAAGTVPQSRIDDMVLRMLTPLYALGLFADPPPPGRNLSAPALSDAHNALARSLALRSITLLKNEGGLLPVNAEALASVVVLGDADTVHGDGSGGVITPYIITPAQGLFSLINNGAWAVPTAGPPGVCAAEDGWDYYQNDSPSTFAATAADCCTACSNTAGCASWTWGQTTCWLKPNASGRKQNPGLVSGNVTAHPPPPPSPPGAVNVTYYAGQDAAGAAAACAGASLCVMVVATKSSEGSDRADLSLPAWQDTMAAAVVAANANTVVVARCPGACFMPWRDQARAILFELMPGQESGNSVAATILGWNNPSGRLPVSFPASMTDTWLGNPVNPTQYPGTDRGRGFPESDYTEELNMGYRWYDSQNTSPLWPFGFGLSYSNFTYSALAVTGTLSPTASVSIYATVCNSAGPSGSEVSQLYVGFPAAANEPPKLLKGFQKTALEPGECAGVGFPVAAKDLWIWDVVAQQWALIPGTYSVMIGSGSRDIRLTGSLAVTA